MTTNNAEKVRKLAKEFIQQNEGVPFERKQLEAHVDSKINVSPGTKTGALNRFLLANGNDNGITQIKRGLYIYDSSNKSIPQKMKENSIDEQLIRLMDNAFKNAKEIINTMNAIDLLIEKDSKQLNKYRELLQIKTQIDQILQKS